MAEPIATVGDLAGVCGHDGDGWQKVGISASKRLQVETEDPSGADLTDVISKLSDILTELNAKLETADLDLDGSGRLSTNQHQYDGSTWRKSSLLWGYSGVVSETASDTNLDAGANTLNATTVPSGEVWVVSAITGTPVSATITFLYLDIVVDSVAVRVYSKAAPTSSETYMVTGQFVLGPGDNVRAVVLGATAGDDLYLSYAGYKMNVEM